MSSSTTTSPAASSTTPSAAIQKNFSCVLCAQRKVKCDKAPGGCANCTKARVTCIYKAPPPPRRRKKGAREIDVHTKLRLYEDALRKLGVDPENIESEDLPRQRAHGAPGAHSPEPLLPDGTAAENSKTVQDVGVLFSEDGKSRYLENGLWTSLKGEFRDTRELLDSDSSDNEALESYDHVSPQPNPPDPESWLLGSPRSGTGLRHFHPQPLQIFKFWQTYLENINPIVKILHTPTVQQTILNASADLEDIPKSTEALMFAMYSLSLASLGDSECYAIMGESKSIVTKRFHSCAQNALVNAGYLKTSDPTVLQAYVLYLLSLQNHDARVLWTLTGVASRIGQRLGLHRDGEILGLPPFEAEMRRRLWWQIMFLEGFAEKLAGVGGNLFAGDTRPPSNLNDSELSPGMKELPREREGATEMMHFLIRCHVGEFLKRVQKPGAHFDGAWNKLTDGAVSATEKDKAIDELELSINQKYLQYCDSSIPWHVMSIRLAEAILTMMRFMCRNPEPRDDSKTSKPQHEKDALFDIALRICSLQNLGYTMQEMQGFLWHINLHFQWKALIYVVAELRYRTQAPEADAAWKQIKLTFDFHPNFAEEVSKRALPVALSSLTLKAWDAFVTARGIPEGGEPYFIQVIRARRSSSKSASRSPEPFEGLGTSVLPNHQSRTASLSVPSTVMSEPISSLESSPWVSGLASSLDVPPMVDTTPLDTDAMSWEAWDNLLSDFQMHNQGAPFLANIPNF